MNKAEAIEELNKVKSQLSESKSNAHLLVPVQDLLNDPVVVADAVLQARALILHAFILFETDTSKAFEIYQQAKALCPEDSHQDIKLDLLRLHGRYLVSKTQFGKAAQTFEQALELAESSSSPKIVMSILRLLASCYANIGRQAKAQALFTELDRLQQEDGSEIERALNLRIQVLVGVNVSEDHSIIESGREAIEILESHGLTLIAAQVYLYLAYIQNRFGDLAAALDCSNKALIVFEERGLSDYIAEVSGVLASTYGALGEYEKGIELELRALALLANSENVTTISNGLGLLGYFLNRTGRFDEAITHLQRAITLIETTQWIAPRAIHLGNLGESYMRLGQFEDAHRCYMDAISVAQSIKLSSSVGYDLCSLSELYANDAFDGYDLDKAEDFARQSIDTLSNSNALAEVGRSYQMLAQIYRRKEQWKEFALTLEKYNEIQSKIHSEAAKKKSEQMEFARRSAERERQHAVERTEARVTQEILLRILPEPIAQRLIKGEKVADYVDNISILFADIVGFTAMASVLKPDVVVDLLNYVFQRFDEIVAKHGCEKVKTIGDGYMAVAGAPIYCEDHCERLARVAIEMQREIRLPESIGQHLPEGMSFGVRIGLHNGPAVCAVMGTHRFVWDVYSDAVNIAARMESTGSSGAIHVSEHFAESLRSTSLHQTDGYEFLLLERGEIEVKGKGAMRTYYLEMAGM